MSEPGPREYELALAILLLAAAAFLVARSREQAERVRLAAIRERQKRLAAEDEVERHERNMDGALETIGRLNDRLDLLDDLQRPGAADRPGGARPADAGRPAAAGD